MAVMPSTPGAPCPACCSSERGTRLELQRLNLLPEFPGGYSVGALEQDTEVFRGGEAQSVVVQVLLGRGLFLLNGGDYKGKNPFMRPHKLRINLALRDKDYDRVDPSLLPYLLEVDYVRYYVKK